MPKVIDKPSHRCYLGVVAYRNGNGGGMVRVIIEHKAKDPAGVIDVIRELRNEAMKQPGYITGETLVNTEDNSNILVISTWQTLENWKAWDTSELRRKITQRVYPMLLEPYTVRTYGYQVFKVNRVWSTF